MSEDPQAAALRHELHGYEARGREDRAAQVRAELARIGHPVATAQQAEPKHRAVPPRKKA